MRPIVQIMRPHWAGTFNVQTVEFGTGFLLPEHHHEWSCFQVVLQGRFLERGISATGPLGPGTLIYRPSGTPHENPPLPSASVSLCVQLGEAVRRDTFPEVADVVAPQLSRSAEILGIAGRIRGELARPDDLSGAVVEAACLELLASVVRRSRRAHQPGEAGLVRRALALIGKRGVRLRVEALADELEVSRHQLNRAFTKAKRCSVGTYLRWRRLLEARRMIEETRTPLAQVAVLTGFADQSHMTRQFQVVFGDTPGKFRGVG